MTQNGVRPSTSPEADDKRARYDALVTDLEDEIAELDALLVGLRPDQWRYDTQSRGWSVAHQIGHLELTETLMYTAITDEDTFRVLALSSRTKPEISDVDFANADLGKKQRARWTRSRGDLLDEFRKADPSTRMPWVGVSMSMTSAVTARIMEVWAHGEDVYGAVGAGRVPTKRLRHVAHLAVAARDFSFLNRKLAAPAEPFRVEIRGPDGELWSWGPEDAKQRVEGEAYDFALLATRRLHRADARVTAVGKDAVRWLKTIQAYAGPPGPRRKPRGA